MKLRLTCYTNPQTCQPCAEFARDLDIIKETFPSVEFIIITTGNGKGSPTGFIPYFLVEDVSDGEPASFVAALNVYLGQAKFFYFLSSITEGRRAVEYEPPQGNGS